MREVSSDYEAIWAAGDYTGDHKPMARVTVAHPQVKLFDLQYNLYASIVFGEQANPPKELPNVKSVKWNRSIDSDVATATIEFYNTAPQQLGTTFQPKYGIDQPGYYTFSRGKSSFSSRWGDTPNEWSGLLVPDNILRTYEGYGFDAAQPPEKDPHLYQTGVWIIKSVTYTAIGLITCECEDLAAIMRDQIVFHPIIPANFYPLSFSAEPKQSGFKQGYTFTKSVDTGGGFDAAHPPPDGWTGPTNPVPGVSISSGDGTATITWGNPPGAPAGYRLASFQLVVDNVRLPEIISASRNSAVLGSPVLQNGNVALVQVVANYERTKDGHEQVGQQGTVQFSRPGAASAGVVTAQSVIIDDAPPPANPTDAQVPVPGVVGFNYTGTPDTFMVICFLADGTRQTFSVAPSGTGRQFYDTHLGGLAAAGYNVLVYPMAGGNAGAGDLYTTTGAYLNPPVGGAPPHAPNPAQPHPVVTTKKGVVPLKPALVQTTFRSSSNAYYVGSGKDVEVYGHAPEDAFDGSDSTYWLSIGNDRNDQGYSYEWIEANVPNVELAQVRYITAKGNYFVYVSVFAKGTWVHYKSTDIIPYDARNPESHNGGNIPFCATSAEGSGEGPHTVTLKTPIPGATRVRLTFHNLQDFGVGLPYRAGVKDFKCYSGGTKEVTTKTTTIPAPIPGPPQDDNSAAIASTYTVYVPPEEKPGAGEQPGFYEDFTDIIKLFCAWAGFYWPPEATIKNSDGSIDRYEFGPGLFGLKNVDPVLGGQEAGRVWGDFMDTGTAGVATLPVSQFDKKPLLDGINYIRDIIGYLFFIDEKGGVVWRLQNIYSIGNYVGTLGSGPVRVPRIITIDEKQTLMQLNVKLSSRNVRERYFVASTDGRTGALAQGYNPNPIGLRRIAGWTDQHFGTTIEAQIMADFIALRALMTYQVDSLQIPGHVGIQIDDQIRIFERVTGEGFLHYVRGITSNNDLETGVYTNDLETNLLGDNPNGTWIFTQGQLSSELKAYLDAVIILPTEPVPVTDVVTVAPPPGPTSNTPPNVGVVIPDVEKIVKLVRVTGQPEVYITDGITKRHVASQVELQEIVKLGLVPNATILPITGTTLATIPDAP